MRLLSILLGLVPLLASGGESYFFVYSKEARPTEKIIEDKHLQVVIPIRKIDPPSASSIFAYHQGLGPGREYQIQVNLKKTPPKDWLPMLKLDDDVIIKGIHIGLSDKPDDTSTYSLQGDDPEKIRRWCLLLGTLLKVPQDQIEIDLTKGGWDTAPPADENEEEGKKKSQPEAKPDKR
jgi:hypothetical protein